MKSRNVKVLSVLTCISLVFFLVACNQESKNAITNMEDDGKRAEKYDYEQIIYNNDELNQNEAVEKKEKNIKETHPDDYYIRWAVPEGKVKVKDEWVDALNRKLEEDGFDFGLEFVELKDSSGKNEYEDGILKCGADIVFTGFEWDGVNIAEAMIEQGVFADLTGLVDESSFFSYMAPVIRESITWEGKIYLLPTEMAQDGGEQLLVCDVAPSNFNIEDINTLRGCISDDNKLFYGWKGFDYTRCFGLDYDPVRGVVLREDGTLVNPLEEESCIEWMTLINDMYKNGCVQYINREEVKLSCGIRLVFSNDRSLDKGYKVGIWPLKMCKRFKCSTGILAGSDKKEKAFKLLELIRENHDYGNLLIYGHTEKREGTEEPFAYYTKLILGLDDGLLSAEEGMKHFMSSEERNAFYCQNVKPSVTLYMDIPIESTKLKVLVDEYLGYDNSILFSPDFEERLKVFKKEYSEAFEKVIQKMSEDSDEAGMQ